MEEIRKFKKRQKKLKKKEKKKKREKKKLKGDVDRGDGIFCSIPKSDIPSDPPNYFLARRIPSPPPEKKPEVKERDGERNRDRDRESRRKEKKDDSGRPIKGNNSNFIARSRC